MFLNISFQQFVQMLDQMKLDELLSLQHEVKKMVIFKQEALKNPSSDEVDFWNQQPVDDEGYRSPVNFVKHIRETRFISIRESYDLVESWKKNKLIK